VDHFPVNCALSGLFLGIRNCGGVDKYLGGGVNMRFSH